jgi:hypothetical protein
MECCGEPFAVSDVVEWNLADAPDVDWLAAAIGGDLAAQVTHQEDHHDLREDAITRKGKILSIRCAYCRYAPTPGGDERELYPVAGTAEITSAERIDGREGAGSSTLHFIGYLVELDLEARVAACEGVRERSTGSSIMCRI